MTLFYSALFLLTMGFFLDTLIFSKPIERIISPTYFYGGRALEKLETQNYILSKKNVYGCGELGKENAENSAQIASEFPQESASE